MEFIDVIGDKQAEHGDSLLTSVLFDYSGVYKEMIADLQAGQFGQVHTMDLSNAGVRLLDLPERVSQEAKDAVADAETAIKDGSVEVSAVADAEGLKAKLAELFPQS